METIKKPVSEGTTAAPQEHLLQQEMAITKAEKATTEETITTPKGEHVIDTALDGGAQVTTNATESRSSVNDWVLALHPQKKTISSKTTIHPEHFAKSLQHPALKNKRKADTDEPSVQASKTKAVNWSTPVLSDPDAELDRLTEFASADPLAHATDSDDELKHVYAVQSPSWEWNSDVEDSDATSDESDYGLNSHHEEEADDGMYVAYVERINQNMHQLSHKSITEELERKRKRGKSNPFYNTSDKKDADRYIARRPQLNDLLYRHSKGIEYRDTLFDNAMERRNRSVAIAKKLSAISKHFARATTEIADELGAYRFEVAMLENSETTVQGNRMELEAAAEKDALLIAKQARDIEKLVTENENLKSKMKDHAKLQKAHRKVKRKYLDSDDFADYSVDQLKNVKKELAEVKDKPTETKEEQAEVKPELAKAQAEADLADMEGSGGGS